MPLDLQVKIKEVIGRNYNIKSLRLQLSEAPEFKAGQFMAVTLNNGPKFKRYLSISNSPTEKCYLEFTKKITQSDFSKALDDLRVGDTLNIQYPFGKFTLDEQNKKIAFLSGGIGITPIRSICKYVVDQNLSSMDLVLIYANHSIKDIIFKEDFDFMQREFPNLRVVYVLSEPASGFSGIIGVINSQVVREEIPDYNLRKFYLCGPTGMVESMKKMLAEELLITQDNIITENFAGYS